MTQRLLWCYILFLLMRLLVQLTALKSFQSVLVISVCSGQITHPDGDRSYTIWILASLLHLSPIFIFLIAESLLCQLRLLVLFHCAAGAGLPPPLPPFEPPRLILPGDVRVLQRVSSKLSSAGSLAHMKRGCEGRKSVALRTRPLLTVCLSNGFDLRCTFKAN